MRFKQGRAWFLAVYREGKKTQKMSRKRQDKIRGQESDEISSISGSLLSFGLIFKIFD
jgi:hypothetical protein